MRNIADNRLFTTNIKVLVWYVENKVRRLQANGMGCLMLPVASMCTSKVLLIVKSCRPMLHRITIGQWDISLWPLDWSFWSGHIILIAVKSTYQIAARDSNVISRLGGWADYILVFQSVLCTVLTACKRQFCTVIFTIAAAHRLKIGDNQYSECVIPPYRRI